MERRYGPPGDFAPPHDGGLPADRLAIFVAVRESLVTRRATSASSLTGFIGSMKQPHDAHRPTVDKITEKLGAVRGGTAMVSGLIDYFGARFQQLLAADM